MTFPTMNAPVVLVDQLPVGVDVVVCHMRRLGHMELVRFDLLTRSLFSISACRAALLRALVTDLVRDDRAGLLERRRVVGERDPHEPVDLLGLGPHQPKVLRAEALLLHPLGPQQAAVGGVGPLVVGTHQAGGPPRFLRADLRPAVSARIVERADATALVCVTCVEQSADRTRHATKRRERYRG